MKKQITSRDVESAKAAAKPYEIRDTKMPGLILRIQPTGYRAWYFEAGWGGARRARIGNARAVTLAQARQRASELLAESHLGNRPGDAQPSTRKIPKLGDFIADTYTPHYTAHHRNTKNLANLRQFRDLYDLRLDQITAATVRSWREKRANTGASPATINRNVNALKACLAHAVDVGKLKAPPLARLGRLKVDEENRVRYLSGDEAKRLRAALDAREDRIRAERRSANEWRAARGYAPLPFLDNLPFADYLKPAVLLSLNTGLRQGELFDLRWSDVGESVTVRASTAKSGKSRHVPLNREAGAVLKGWREVCDPSAVRVFPGRAGGRMDNVRRSWGAVLDAAGLEDFRWHDLRHDFASRLVMGGVPLNTVRDLLGHADVKMTLRYAHLAPGHMLDAVGVLDAEQA